MMDLMNMLKPATLEEQKKKEASKKEKPKKEKVEKTNEVKSTSKSKYKYPFEIYIAARKHDVSHIFQEDTEYTDDQITKAMLEHGFYEFAGKVTYDFIEKDNVLVPVFQQHKKG